MIAILWRYEVQPEHRARFEAAYGPSGDWAKLFDRAEGFEGTVLLCSPDGSYLTIDRWQSIEAFDGFLAVHGADYKKFDQLTEGWTRSEERLGVFEVVGDSATG